MKLFRYFSIFLLVNVFSVAAIAQVDLGHLVKKKPVQPDTGPTAGEMGLGLKEALEAGVSAGADRLSAVNGFLGNNAVKILFPPEAQKIERTLRGIGAGKLCDDLIMSLNRAAEDAAKEAKPIFIAAIRKMSFQDASKILLSGQQDAATQYFKGATTNQLHDKFLPVIQTSLDKVGAAKNWASVTTAYNKVPLTSKVNTDLNDYVTRKAISGLFYEVAREELRIRSDPSARSSPVLQKVFGWLHRE